MINLIVILAVWLLFFLLILHDKKSIEMGKFRFAWIAPKGVSLPFKQFKVGKLTTTTRVWRVSVSVIHFKRKKATWKNQTFGK